MLFKNGAKQEEIFQGRRSAQNFIEWLKQRV
jgi:hypothetical protein